MDELTMQILKAAESNEDVTYLAKGSITINEVVERAEQLVEKGLVVEKNRAGSWGEDCTILELSITDRGIQALS